MTGKPSCERCKGACCESFMMPEPPQPHDDATRWLSLHGRLVGFGNALPSSSPHGFRFLPPRMLEFECRCTQLTVDGRCRTYKTRPVTCQVYEVGGAECLATIKRRRTAEEVKEIMR